MATGHPLHTRRVLLAEKDGDQLHFPKNPLIPDEALVHVRVGLVAHTAIEENIATVKYFGLETFRKGFGGGFGVGFCSSSSSSSSSARKASNLSKIGGKVRVEGGFLVVVRGRGL